MDLDDLKARVSGIADRSHAEKITIFGWWLHVHKGKVAFTPSDIGKCYDAAHFARPSSFGGYFQNLLNSNAVLKARGGYKLEHKSREQLDTAYGASERTIKIKALLSDLADKLPTLAERDYYREALICYSCCAFRAAVIMIWNVALSHLCDHVLAKRLADFNARWLVSYRGMHKNKTLAIASMDDFNAYLKESEVLIICRDAGIITKNIYNVMEPALRKRNTAAHPSTVVISQMQADAFIEDLIVNAVLKVV